MKKALTYLALFGVILTLHASEQPLEMLYYKGQRYYIKSSGFEEKYSPFLPFIFRLEEHKKDSLLQIYNGCHRGYKAVWEIRNDSLFLKQFYVGCGRKVPLAYIFDDENSLKEAFSDWFSGRLFLQKDDIIEGKVTHSFFIEKGIVKVCSERE